jgi:hypothetical protein
VAGTTNAVTAWPHRSSGRPTTTTSATAGHHTSAASISSGYTFSPPVLIMSSTRPDTHRSPSSSATARSPVKYQPSRTAFAVASGRRQYPAKASGLSIDTTTWPCAPGATTSSGPAPGSGSTSRTRLNTPARPAQPGLAATSGPMVNV